MIAEIFKVADSGGGVCVSSSMNILIVQIQTLCYGSYTTQSCLVLSFAKMETSKSLCLSFSKLFKNPVVVFYYLPFTLFHLPTQFSSLENYYSLASYVILEPVLISVPVNLAGCSINLPFLSILLDFRMLTKYE